jgi:uncharacterized protein YndB with AHSA1/START domain
MGRAIVTSTADFEVAPEAVWAVIGDLRRLPEWLDSHDAFLTEPSATREGVTFRHRVTQLDRSAEVDWTVDTVEIPSRLILVGKGPMNVKVRFSLAVEKTPTGSTLTYRTEYSSLLLNGPLITQVENSATTVMEQSLGNLRALLG